MLLHPELARARVPHEAGGRCCNCGSAAHAAVLCPQPRHVTLFDVGGESAVWEPEEDDMLGAEGGAGGGGEGTFRKMFCTLAHFLGIRATAAVITAAMLSANAAAVKPVLPTRTALRREEGRGGET